MPPTIRPRITDATTHITPAPDENPRVLAVLAYLRSA